MVAYGEVVLSFVSFFELVDVVLYDVGVFAVCHEEQWGA